MNLNLFYIEDILTKLYFSAFQKKWTRGTLHKLYIINIKILYFLIKDWRCFIEYMTQPTVSFLLSLFFQFPGLSNYILKKRLEKACEVVMWHVFVLFFVGLVLFISSLICEEYDTLHWHIKKSNIIVQWWRFFFSSFSKRISWSMMMLDSRIHFEFHHFQIVDISLNSDVF